MINLLLIHVPHVAWRDLGAVRQIGVGAYEFVCQLYVRWLLSVSITDFGAVADGRTNNQKAIQAAFDYAKAHGESVVIPTGTFAYSGTLTASGIKVTGNGDGSVLKALDPHNEALFLTGNGGALSGFQMQGNTSAGRLVNFETAMIVVRDATNYTVENMHINGSASVGVFSVRSSYGKIQNNTIENTKADSIHNVDGSHHLTITGNRIMNSGDDGISVVSYKSAAIAHDILIQGNTVLNNNWGRGLTVVGGDNVQILGNHVDGGTNDRAGIYIAAESEYNTFGVSNVTVRGNTLVDTGGAQSGHGAITVYNSQAGSTTITGVKIEQNQIVDPRADGVLFVGNGQISASMTGNSMYADGNKLYNSLDPAASVTQSGNTSYPMSSYSTPLVPAGGGVGTGTGTGTPPDGGSTGGEPTPGTSFTISSTGTKEALPTGIADATHPVSGAPTKFVTTLNTSAVVTGTSGNDQITGLKGAADTQGLAGGKGDDIYVVDRSTDKVTENAGEGVDTVASYSSTYTLSANVENLVIKGTAAAVGLGNSGANILVANDAGSQLYAEGGVDLLYGGKGADVLNGGAGADSMKGGLGNDKYAVNDVYDKVVEASSQGVDTVESSVSYTLGSYLENLTLVGTGAINGTGSSYHNVLKGNDGNNVLKGLGGNDVISGGKGADVITGGTGNDTFVLKTPGTGVDTIKDFTIGQDNLNVQAVLKAVGATTVSQALQNHLLEVVQNGSSAEVRAHVQTAVIKVAVVENMNAGQLLKTSDHWQ